MYKCLQIPGVKYVLAKIERAAWGWTQEESVRHAKWVSELSLKHSGMDGGRWLSEEEFKRVLGHYVSMLNSGKIAGLRIFSAGQFYKKPEYIDWAKEILDGVK